MNFSASVKVEYVLRLNTNVEDYEILHMMTKIQNFSTLELRDMEFLVTLGQGFFTNRCIFTARGR
jgi:hypothetical protein